MGWIRMVDEPFGLQGIVGTVRGGWVRRGYDRSGIVVATLEAGTWLRAGCDAGAPIVATVRQGRYVHGGHDAGGPCLGVVVGRRVYRGPSAAGRCLGVVDSDDPRERLAGAAALLAGLLDACAPEPTAPPRDTVR